MQRRMMRQAPSANCLLAMGRTKIQHGGCVRLCEMLRCRRRFTGDQWKNGRERRTAGLRQQQNWRLACVPEASALPGQGVRRIAWPGWRSSANCLAGFILPLTGHRHAYVPGTRPSTVWQRGKTTRVRSQQAPCMHARQSNHMQGTATTAANNRHHLCDVQHIGPLPPHLLLRKQRSLLGGDVHVSGGGDRWRRASGHHTRSMVPLGRCRAGSGLAGGGAEARPRRGAGRSG